MRSEKERKKKTSVLSARPQVGSGYISLLKACLLSGSFLPQLQLQLSLDFHTSSFLLPLQPRDGEGFLLLLPGTHCA